MKRCLYLLVSYYCLLFSSQAISEANYEQEYQQKVIPFLQEHEEQSTFLSANGNYKLSYIKLIHPEEKGVVIVLQGRCESWLIYGELFYDLYQKGYTIYAYDHRGQGLSPHLVEKNHQIGHIEHFSDYVCDLENFLTTVIQPIHPQKKGLFVIAHSMGATIVTSYLENHSSPFEAVVLTSPMFKINTAGYLSYNLEESMNAVADYAISGNSNYYTYTFSEENLLEIVSLAFYSGYGKDYALGSKDYNELKPKDKYTTSEPRWSMMNSFVKTQPAAVLGGVSWGWLKEALTTTPTVVAQADFIEDTRLLILQAGDDKVVINNANEEFLKQLSKNVASKTLQLPEARHELFMERDTIRDRVLEEIDHWFDVTD